MERWQQFTIASPKNKKKQFRQKTSVYDYSMDPQSQPPLDHDDYAMLTKLFNQASQHIKKQQQSSGGGDEK